MSDKLKKWLPNYETKAGKNNAIWSILMLIVSVWASTLAVPQPDNYGVLMVLSVSALVVMLVNLGIEKTLNKIKATNRRLEKLAVIVSITSSVWVIKSGEFRAIYAPNYLYQKIKAKAYWQEIDDGFLGYNTKVKCIEGTPENIDYLLSDVFPCLNPKWLEGTNYIRVYSYEFLQDVIPIEALLDDWAEYCLVEPPKQNG